MRVRAVFFDVGNTLLYPYPSVSEVCRDVLLNAGHVRDVGAIDRLMPLVDAYYEDRYREDDTFWTDEAETSGVWVGMYALLCRELGIDEDAEVLARRVYDEFGDPARWRAFDDVRPAFERLRGRGLRLGVISNWDQRLESVLEGLGLGAMLDAVVSSAAVGLHKPDPRIFELACERVGVEPGAAVHVGDHHYADVLGARSVGMTPVLIDRFSGECPIDGVRTLADVEDYLGWR
jgi:putative hydrolase of the HAD superfamily